jgi:integrase
VIELCAGGATCSRPLRGWIRWRRATPQEPVRRRRGRSPTCPSALSPFLDKVLRRLRGLIRVRKADVDLDALILTVRDRKRTRGKRTTRRVPLSTALAAILREWLEVHPGGSLLFAQSEEVFRSKKRSRTTGHANGAERPKSLNGRLQGVSDRERPGILPLTIHEVSDHFRRTVNGGKWSVVPGLHCLRHSFISACASKGLDQRIIDEWVGHQTDEQRRRYRHLYPSVQQAAIRSVFG